ncbi:MAG TPA: DNA methyltransferase, partial [Candidatus Kapabacteria bacterium]|nr:DNA methyltransferase [Candidatus Kapabacteria bacterium]
MAPVLFQSRGVRRTIKQTAPLFEETLEYSLFDHPECAITDRVAEHGDSTTHITNLIREHQRPACTTAKPFDRATIAGKNTYTYDAHTYHTKVPPQGIAELLRYYLPDGGLILDPFAGSGMTGVASRILGLDCILNDLSPAATFIAEQYCRKLSPEEYRRGIDSILNATRELRASLYSTTCRECGKQAELQYTVWSYRVTCSECSHPFVLWDHCREYGKSVKDHRILPEFPCPSCDTILKKSRLKRLDAIPVLVGYKCCGSKQVEVTHSPSPEDLLKIQQISSLPPLIEGFYPQVDIPDGVNLRQPKKHGLTRIADFYTSRNLSALNHIWYHIQRIPKDSVAQMVAFTFTSLYQRVTRLSEFRFWGGSGNTPRFNVPFIFNETNVFLTFERKSRSIEDHLFSAASKYEGEVAISCGSATDLKNISNESIDLIFTDPPFGSFINYSEMNFLWESWLGQYTNNKSEAIINRVQGKGINEYSSLMEQSFKECFRVLRRDHWMLVVFMNSSGEVWEGVRNAIIKAGFQIVTAHIYD